MAVDSIVVLATRPEPKWHQSDRGPGCSPAQIKAIRASLTRIYGRIDRCDLFDLVALKANLKRSHTKDCVWHCTDLGPGRPAVTSFHRQITIHPDTFKYKETTFDAVVFHEMIHRCGGTELDAEAFENHCFRGAGATAPTPDDFPKFKKYGSKFVDWNESTGEVRTKEGQPMKVIKAAFIDRTP
jgi:hypothetical protein